MNSDVVPPVVAGFVAVVISVANRISTILVSSSMEVPAPRTLAQYLLGGRFVAFVLVYGLLLGVAYWAGTRRGDPTGDGTVVLATGGVGALAHLVGTGVVLFLVEAEQDVVVTGVATVGSSVGVGVQLAVVAFAGIALARRR